MPSIVGVLWPGFYLKFYGTGSVATAWRRDKWVNLAVSLVHSTITAITASIAVWAVWGEFVAQPNWVKVRVGRGAAVLDCVW